MTDRSPPSGIQAGSGLTDMSVWGNNRRVRQDVRQRWAPRPQLPGAPATPGHKTIYDFLQDTPGRASEARIRPDTSGC